MSESFRRCRIYPPIAVLMFIFVALPSPAFAATTTWSGSLDRSAPTKLSFKYNGSDITKLTFPIIACTSITGYQTETIFVPSIPVHRGHFSVKYHVPHAPKEVMVRVKGDIGAMHASGTLRGTGLCDTGPQPFHAEVK